MTKVSKKQPLISVVVPVYNVEKYIHKCVDSIINQTYKNLEIILVDDGSPDNCPKICDEFAKNDKRIKVIHKQNGGLSDARNVGIEVAKGKYITFIDSDDYIETNYVELLYNTINDDKSDISIGSHKVIYDSGKIIDKSTSERTILNPKEVLKRILYDDGIDLSAWGKLYKLNLFKDIKYPVGRLFEDSATTYLLIDKANKISINSCVIYNYIIRNNSITNSSFNLKKLDLITSTREMNDYILNKYPKLGKACKRRLMWAYLSTFSQLAMCDKRYREEERKLLKYIRKNGFLILIDRKAQMRDKIGIISAMFGIKFYKIIWNKYKKITGRK